MPIETNGWMVLSSRMKQFQPCATLRAMLARHRRVGGRVLVVEDDETTRAHLRDILIKEGCSVDLAEDGLVALSRIEAEMPDLVLLDLRMPRLDGLAAARAIRESYADNPPCLIGVSASAHEVNRQA